MEKDFAAKIRGAIWKLGERWPLIYPNTSMCPKCHHKLYPLPDRPDIIVSIEGIEVKQGDERFAFNLISEGQRNWANARTSEGFSYWIALQLGSAKPDSTKINRKRAWLVPWEKWLEVESLVSPHQQSLPLYISKGSKKELKDNSLDAISLLESYELKWESGTWVIPEDHPYSYNSLVSKLNALVPFSISIIDGKYELRTNNFNATSTSLTDAIEGAYLAKHS
jgi:hypothetical protein